MNKPETLFANAFFSKMPSHVYHEKTHNPLRRSTPDYYVEGIGKSLWIEFKYMDNPWTQYQGVICTSQSWPLQRQWLQRSHDNGHQAIVIVGTKYDKRRAGYCIKSPYVYDGQDLMQLDVLVEHVYSEYIA